MPTSIKGNAEGFLFVLLLFFDRSQYVALGGYIGQNSLHSLELIEIYLLLFPECGD